MKRIIAFLLTVVLTTQAGAAVLGSALLQSTVEIAETGSLTESTYRDTAGRTRKEAYVTYAGGGALLPQVVYGATLFGKSPMNTIENYPNAWGFSVVAGVNGAFFDVSSGIPYGCVITNGAIRSSGNLEAVGFRADGSAIIGVPNLSIQATLPTREAPMDIHVNKVLTKANGLVLYTRDYDSKTKNTISAYNVVLQPETPDLLLGKELVCTVTNVVPNTASCDIPAGCFVLSMATNTDYAATLNSVLKPLVQGDTVTISVSIDAAWQDVVSACAGMEMLLENGVLDTSYTLASAKTRTARTAVGLKADGSLVFYTVDSAGDSTGLTLTELANRMQELGCVTALNLDGGGSTAIRALYPGTTSTQTVNTPSDGSLRKCANFIFLTRAKAEAGDATRLFAYPHDALALPSGRVPLTVKATDENYTATGLPSEILFSTENGIVEDGVFIPQSAGIATVSMTAGDVHGSVSVRVLESPGAISIIREQTGKDAAGTAVKAGVTLSLTGRATYAGQSVYAEDSSFVWTCDSNIGTIDENGLFTAALLYKSTSGKVTCAAGDVSKSITITVVPNNPFPDTETHWAKDFIRAMYSKGVLTGSDKDGILYFRPDDNMTRQEFITALMRYLGSSAEAAELPFADADSVASWAKEAVMQAYAAGILTGSQVGDELYCNPTAPITRQEAMVLLSRTLPYADAPEEDVLAVFPDAANAASWARDGMSRMVQMGIISGMNDGTLNPTGFVTRAQVAKMLAVMAQ